MIPIHGIYSGIVVSTADPERRGRARLQVPQITGLAVTGWADPIVAGPSVIGDQVRVSFEGGDRNFPLFWPKVRRTTFLEPARSQSAANDDAGYVTGANLWKSGLVTGPTTVNQVFAAPISGSVTVSWSAVSWVYQDDAATPVFQADTASWLSCRVSTQTAIGSTENKTYLAEDKNSNSCWQRGAGMSTMTSSRRVTGLPRGEPIMAELFYLVDQDSRRAWFDSMRLRVDPVIYDDI